MPTKADLRRRVLSHLTVIDATEDPDSEQAATLDPIIDDVRAMLLEKGLCWWDEDIIPQAVMLPLRNYICAHACGAFGRAGKGYEAFEPIARRQIAALKSSDQREVVKGEYE